jgi:hypothetical protein
LHLAVSLNWSSGAHNQNRSHNLADLRLFFIFLPLGLQIPLKWAPIPVKWGNLVGCPVASQL